MPAKAPTVSSSTAPPAGSAKRQNTRDRILLTCRKLFNARGPAAVTTAEIAGAVGINEGNLYYYFKKKADIVTALFDQFAEEQLAAALGEESLEARFQLVWKWRFFYRDSATVYPMAPSLRPRLRALSDTVQAHDRKRLHQMVKDGRLRATDEEIDDRG